MRMDGGLWVPGAVGPGTPASGNILYPKSDGMWYTKNSSGVEVLVGSKNVPDPTAGTDAANQQYVLAQIAAMSPTGQRLGSSVRTTSFTSPSTGGVLTGLSVPITGSGRYVDIELFISGVYQSVAATAINVAILVNGSATGGTFATTISYVNTFGPFVHIGFEKLLTNAVSYTFTVFLQTGSGTVTCTATADSPMQLMVTQR